MRSVYGDEQRDHKCSWALRIHCVESYLQFRAVALPAETCIKAVSEFRVVGCSKRTASTENFPHCEKSLREMMARIVLEWQRRHDFVGRDESRDGETAAREGTRCSLKL